MSKEVTHHIKLYQDEFKLDVWQSYCEILGVSPDCNYVFVPFAKNLVKEL
jgi:hypothetical protein